MVGCACQTAKKPVALAPSATVPALKSAVPAPVAAQAASQPAQVPAQQQETVAQKPAADMATNQSSTSSDPVTDLIARVEKEYQAGLTDYHAGNSEEAKQEFDNALNTLLDSNLDVRSDARLQREFEHIVNGVNELYPGGPAESKEAQGSPQDDQQQKSEPAPIDETNGMTPSADAGTKAKAEAEIKSTRSDLPLMMNDQVAGFIAYFSGRGRGVFERAYARSGRYHDMIVSTLKQEGIPQELIYLAQAESGFHPLAVSRAGARGIWQFMAARGRGYGLYHNQWIDDRQDPEKSTRAAAQHLKDLYNQFGDWYLAMAAYNSGPGTVQAAVKRTGYADFWELYRRNVLPKETRNYVPIILAVTIMAKNPSQYGLEDVVKERPSDYDAVTIHYPVDLRLVAQCVNSTPEELQDLNPSLLRLTSPREGEFTLRLPAGTKEQYETTIASIPQDMRLWWRLHTVQSGDTVASVAKTYHVTSKAISDANHLDGAGVETDARLVIPITPGRHPQSEGTYAKRITRYKVHRGDTVETVAENFGIPAQMLRRWNGLRGDNLGGRKVLALHLPVTPSARGDEVASSKAKSKRSKTETANAKPPATKSAQIEHIETARLESDRPGVRRAEPKSEEAAVVHHKVKSGETLYSIASLYRTTVAALKRDNRNVNVIRPGMILIVQAR
jgi:membrane-bound lytic murein transglycosylase D